MVTLHTTIRCRWHGICPRLSSSCVYVIHRWLYNDVELTCLFIGSADQSSCTTPDPCRYCTRAPRGLSPKIHQYEVKSKVHEALGIHSSILMAGSTHSRIISGTANTDVASNGDAHTPIYPRYMKCSKHDRQWQHRIG
jgi:hypothetical protein